MHQRKILASSAQRGKNIQVLENLGEPEALCIIDLAGTDTIHVIESCKPICDS
jgi:hypothetical protein